MKKVFLCLAVFAMSLTAIGQEKEEKTFRLKGIETNRFIDNWEVTALGGVQAFHALGEVELPSTNFGDEFMPEFQISLGKWITPVFGARLAYQGFGINDGTAGNDTTNSSYHYLHTDVMVNLTNWFCGYKSDRFYNAVLLGGFGWAASQPQNMTEADLENATDKWNDEFAATVGLSNRFRICEAIYAHVDLTGMIVKDDFRNVLPSQEGNKGINYELMAGISYHMPTRGFDVVDYTPYKRKISDLEKDLAASRKDLEKGKNWGFV